MSHAGQVAENGGSILVTVSLSQAAPTAGVSVSFATATGSASSSDFTSVSGGLSFASGELTKTFAVSITDDSEFDANESFSVSLSAATEGWTISNPTTSVTIVDDEIPSVVEFAGPETVQTVQEGETLQFTVTLSRVITSAVTVSYSIVGTTGFAANPANDVSSAGGTINFVPGGVLSQTFSLTVVDDLSDEYLEAFRVQLTGVSTTGPANSVVIGTSSSRQVNITDDDDPPTLTITDVSVTEGSSAQPSYAIFVVTPSVPSGKQIFASYGTLVGSAASGVDFTGTSGSIAFSPDSTTGQISVEIKPDYKDEIDETFTLRLDGLINASLLGGASSTTATATIVDNDNIVSPGNQTHKEGTTVSLQINGNSPQYDKNNGQFSATGLPAGLIIAPDTGLISGKVAYTAADLLKSGGKGVYDVEVTLYATGGELLSSTQFVWTITNAYIDSFTVTELHGSSVTSNSQNSSGMGNDEIYVSPGNIVRLSVSSLATLPSEINDVVFSVGATQLGNLSSTLTFAPSSAFSTHVYAGIDLNLNGQLDPGEQTHTINVFVVDFTASKFSAQRVSVPAELTHYEIMENEHFEVGGNFDFEITDSLKAGDPSLIRYELLDQDGVNQVLKEGAGLSFTYTFKTGVDEGDVFVRVYADANDNEVFDAGELYRDSNLFWVMQKKKYEFNLWFSSAIPGGSPTAAVAADLAYGTNILLTKDSADDARAIVELKLTNSSFMFPAGGTVGGNPTPDPIAINEDVQALFKAAPGNTIIVVSDDTRTNAVRGQAEGITSWQWWLDEIVYNNSSHCAETLAHEVGHLVGAEHGEAPDANHIIRAGNATPPRACNTANLVTAAVAKKYDEGK